MCIRDRYKTNDSIFEDPLEHIENISGKIEYFNGMDGHSYVTKIGNSIYVGTDHGLYKKTKSSWEKTNEFGSQKHLTYGIHRIKEMPDNKIWMVLFHPFFSTTSQ